MSIQTLDILRSCFTLFRSSTPFSCSLNPFIPWSKRRKSSPPSTESTRATVAEPRFLIWVLDSQNDHPPEESQRIQEEFLKQMRTQGTQSLSFSHPIEMERMKNAKLTMNYLIVIAIIGEFCNKWVFSIFDTVVSIYGMEHFQLDAFMFGVMSCIGSLVNMVQTGWLFTFLIRKDFSIPTMASWAGIVGGRLSNEGATLIV